MLSDDNFIHLNTHSVYSLLESIAKIDDLLKATIDNKLKALAITDYASTCGISEFYVKSKKLNIKPIFGFTSYIYSFLPPEREGKPKRSQIVLLAKNNIGYRNLIKLHNIAWEKFYYKPVLTYEQLFEHKEGLIVLSANLRGDIRWAFREGKEKFNEFIEMMDKNLGDNFYLEAQAANDTDIKGINRAIFDSGHQYVITSNVHYIKKEENKTHNILLLMSQKKTIKELTEGKAWVNNHDDFYYKSPEEIKSQFTEEQWQHCLASCKKIYDEIENIEILDKPHLPQFSEEPEKDIVDIIKKNLHRLPRDKKDEYISRIKHELNVYRKTNSFNYLLIVKDFIDKARERGCLVNYGRGSACSSLVTYLMDIHKIDPIKVGLYFMRFLNESRGVKMKVF